MLECYRENNEVDVYEEWFEEKGLDVVQKAQIWASGKLYEPPRKGRQMDFRGRLQDLPQVF